MNVEFIPNFFTLLFHFHQEALQFFFTFCHKGDVICTSEVIDISPGNLYSGEEATVRIGNGTMDWFQVGKGVCQGCILSPCLFNLYAQYIMRNAGLDEAQAGLKIPGRNINNLRYADDTVLMAESEEELRAS